ncbi:MAG: glycoside hydrolase family 130 protein [candidate division Zixibacteria bacterium]|nr:glycoside hydrolase family 130 protein [candidate division Zixibacteria bacterium]
MNRYHKNPIITRGDIPSIKPHLVDVSSVFNPGAVKFQNSYLLLLRIQNRGRETFLISATSRDGKSFDINDKVITFSGIEKIPETIYHIYDPRITHIGDTYYIVFAIDIDGGCRLGIAKTRNFESYSFLGIVSDNDSRNGVLFPEKINNQFCMLERPNSVKNKGNAGGGDEIWLSASEDLIKWNRVGPILTGRAHYWDEFIGSGPPPVKTTQGWLHIYHGIASHFSAASIYQAGVVLLDLADPSIVIARGKYNILEPREPYELIGQVPNVVFPTGLIVDDFDNDGFAKNNSEVKVYYGASDSSTCLATTTIKDLLDACYDK